MDTSPVPKVPTMAGKGEIITGGTTGLVQRLPSGDVAKIPWAGDAREEDCRREMATEARIYERLGQHARLVEMKHWDLQTYTITLASIGEPGSCSYLYFIASATLG